jgi:hypothetical protein
MIDKFQRAPVTKNSKEYGNGLWIEGHCFGIFGRIGYSSCFLTGGLEFQEVNHRAQEVSSMTRDIVRQPFVQIEVFSPRSKSGDVEREGEWSYIQQSVKNL